MKKAMLVAVLTGAAWPCQAASIAVNQAAIAIDGDLEVGDFETFQSRARLLTQATVILRSNGGRLGPALRIGEVIRQKRWSTLVLEYCSSACSLIWLAGTQRYMAANAQIGFHAAYDDRTGQEGGMANAVVGSFLTRLGYGYEAVMYATVAAPNSMKWLTPVDAKRVGIDVNVINPEPSLGQHVQPASKQPSLKEKALQFVSYYFANWNTDYYPRVFNELYWDSANYYGQITSKQDILIEQLKVLEQWPARSYKLRSAEATCDPKECNVTGIVDWEASNQARHSTGSAIFNYVLRPWPLGGAGADDRLRISAESRHSRGSWRLHRHG